MSIKIVILIICRGSNRYGVQFNDKILIAKTVRYNTIHYIKIVWKL